MVCKECEEENLDLLEKAESSEASYDEKSRQNYHEKTAHRNFLIKVWKTEKDFVNFYVDFEETERFHLRLPEHSGDHLEFSWNSGVKPENFHKYLESALPSLYGLRPVPISMSNISALLDILEFVPCEPLLTNCERFLMNTDLLALDGSMLISILGSGLKSKVDHKILTRVLCICLMNPGKLANASSELRGNVGAVFAQAFVSNSSKQFRHVKPLEKIDERRRDRTQLSEICPAVRNLMNRTNKRKPKCNHEDDEEDDDEFSFQCVVCSDVRCPKCKGENSFCLQAINYFLYEVRGTLYPKTYRAHCDREELREKRFTQYIYQNQLLPLEE